MRFIKNTGLALLIFLFPCAAKPQTAPLPSKAQLAAQNMEYYLFAHFGPNTFTGAEWGHGNEKEEVFNPSQLDCRQWARIAKAAGAKGIIITAKHHDGFCLWPSKFSTHTVRESKWRNGNGDVLKELSAACKEYGIKFGVYLSPWDRNHPAYGTEAYNEVYINMMKEIFANYSPIWELWWDGANGEGPNGKKQVYDWPRFRETVRKLSPNTVVFSDIGPDLRWVGNEKGIAGITNWNLLNTAGFTTGAGAPPTDTLNQGNKFGKNWVSAECDVSIRPGWFYHGNEDNAVKTPEQLFALYLKSIGRGANLLLNVPPDGKGLFSESDSVALMGFKKLHDNSFKQNLALTATKLLQNDKGTIIQSAFADGDINTATTFLSGDKNILWIKFTTVEKINCISIQEKISKGQNIAKGKVMVMNKTKIVQELPFTTIGHKRILTFPTTEATAVKLIVKEAKANPTISEIAIYKINDELIESQ